MDDRPLTLTQSWLLLLVVACLLSGVAGWILRGVFGA